MNKLERLINELPPLAAIVLSVLFMLGYIAPAEADQWMQVVGGLNGIAMSVIFRQNNDGIITLWKNAKSHPPA